MTALARLHLPVLFCVWLFAAATAFSRAAGPAEALAAADDRRVAAMKAGDRAGIEEAFSENLRYAHSNGQTDTRASLLAALESGRMRYKEIRYTSREFSFPVPGCALMTGQARVVAGREGREAALALSFLAVWRLEEGRWKLLAWQSCPLPQ